MSCGKTMIATNLAFSFSRQRNTRCILADVDLKRPQVRKNIGLESQLSMGDYLMGGVRPEEFFIRLGENLAIGPTSQSFRHSAELLQHPDAKKALDDMHRVLQPDIVIYDPAGRTEIGIDKKHHMNMDHAAWEGFDIDGRVDTVVSRGKVVIDNDEYLGSKGHGQYLKRGMNQYLV